MSSRLLHFPAPFPDETLHNLVTRYHLISGNRSKEITFHQLFHKNEIAITTGIPGGLSVLFKKVAGHSWGELNQLVDQHTLFPYYRPFLSPESIEFCWSNISSPEGRNITNSFGEATGKIPMTKHPRFCVHCVEEDIEVYGQPYWHRSHQLPGVLVCYKHGVQLIDSCPSCGPLGKYRGDLFLPRLVCACGYNFVSTESKKETSNDAGHDLSFSILSHSLLQSNISPIDSVIRNKVYRKTLASAGYGFPAKLDRDRFVRDLENYYGKEKLHQLGCSFTKGPQTSWFKKIIQPNNQKDHPVRHLLLIGFLFGSIDKYIESIKYINITKPKEKKVSGNTEFEELELLLVTNGRCVKKVAKILGASARTIRVQAKRQGIEINEYEGRKNPKRDQGVLSDLLALLPVKDIAKRNNTTERMVYQILYMNKDIETKRSKLLFEKDRRHRRDGLLQARNRYPDASRRELVTKYPDIYAWLYANDREWFEENLPEARTPKVKLIYKDEIDWCERDRRLEKKVREVASEFNNLAGRPRRITKNRIGSKLGSSNIKENNLEKLPKTRAAIEEVVESAYDCQKRRIKWVMENLFNNKLRPAPSALLQAAGIPYKTWDDHKDYVNSLL